MSRVFEACRVDCRALFVEAHLFLSLGKHVPGETLKGISGGFRVIKIMRSPVSHSATFLGQCVILNPDLMQRIKANRPRKLHCCAVYREVQDYKYKVS